MATPAMTIPRRIVVGLDGSSGSARALSWAIGVAKALDAQILAVHVFQLVPALPAAYGLAPIPYSDEWREELQAQFENEWCLPLKQAGVPYETAFEMGSPAATLIAIAQAKGADLIVTGTRGMGGFKELMLGSVSHQLVLHATVPVVVIPVEAKLASSLTKDAKLAAAEPVSGFAPIF